MEIIFSGMVGAIITAIVTYWIFHKSQKPPSGKAYKLLQQLGKRLKVPEGEYYFTKSSNDNFTVAKDIYTLADGNIISTAFHEDPSNYESYDLARSFQFGYSSITRITTEDVCYGDKIKKATENLNTYINGAKFVIIPTGQSYTRIDGIFCRFSDDTYLSFIAFRDPANPNDNQGVIFRNGIAEGFYRYYEQLAKKYYKKSSN